MLQNRGTELQPKNSPQTLLSRPKELNDGKHNGRISTTRLKYLQSPRAVAPCPSLGSPALKNCLAKTLQSCNAHQVPYFTLII